MSLKLWLESIGPGRGLLYVEGPAEPAESVNLAIQRNDGRYLGHEGHWQPTPYWHPQFSAEPTADGLRMELGPALMDGIIANHGAPLMLTLRIDGREDHGVVRVRGALIGSNAAAQEQQGRPDARAAAGLAPDQMPPLDTRPSEEPAHMQASAGTDVRDPPDQARSRWPLLIGAAVVLLIAAGAALWYFDWPQQFLAGKDTEPASAKAEPAETEKTEPEPGFAPSPESALTGVEFVVRYLGGRPSADAIMAEAESRSEAGDCDAALILYARAAESDPALGLPVAQLFDPTTFAEGGCVDAASEDTALEYYRGAAEAGEPEAMRRAGEILTARAASGPVHEEGAEWLRRAESAVSAEDPRR